MTVIRLRALLVSALGALIVVVAASAAAAPAGSGDRAISSNAALERSIVSEINALRASKGLPRLAISRGLALAARGHSREMALTGYFSHTSRDGRAFDERVRRYYGSKGYRSWRAGENLLWASPEIDGERAVQMWLDSPAHRQILLSRAWREIGLSAVHTTSAPRVYEGLEATIVTADFGVRTR